MWSDRGMFLSSARTHFAILVSASHSQIWSYAKCFIHLHCLPQDSIIMSPFYHVVFWYTIYSQLSWIFTVWLSEVEASFQAIPFSSSKIRLYWSQFLILSQVEIPYFHSNNSATTQLIYQVYLNKCWTTEREKGIISDK